MDIQEGYNTKISEFNMSLALLERLNNIMGLYDDAMLSNKINPAFEFLQMLYDEVHFSLEDKEILKLKQLEDEIDKKINDPKININQTYQINHNGLQTLVYKYPQQRKEVKVMLREYYRTLRANMQNKGLLLKQRGDEDLF